jgi:hypothetical protein
LFSGEQDIGHNNALLPVEVFLTKLDFKETFAKFIVALLSAYFVIQRN